MLAIVVLKQLVTSLGRQVTLTIVSGTADVEDFSL